MTNSSPITINVKPLRSGWTLECDGVLESQVFRTGGEAERSAVRLAAALTKAGWCARVVVRDLDNTIAGSLEVTPNTLRQPQWRRTIH
jgi:hypothetical protein